MNQLSSQEKTPPTQEPALPTYKLSAKAGKIKATRILITLSGIAGGALLFLKLSMILGVVFFLASLVASTIYGEKTEPLRFASEEDYKIYKEEKRKAAQIAAKKNIESIQRMNLLPKQPKKSDNSPVSCPKCNSTQFHADKRGFNLGRAVVGTIATLGVGVVAGAIGKDKIILTCLVCGHSWPAGKAK